jgi:hypothetical protein
LRAATEPERERIEGEHAALEPEGAPEAVEREHAEPDPLDARAPGRDEGFEVRRHTGSKLDRRLPLDREPGIGRDSGKREERRQVGAVQRFAHEREMSPSPPHVGGPGHGGGAEPAGEPAHGKRAADGLEIGLDVGNLRDRRIVAGAEAVVHHANRAVAQAEGADLYGRPPDVVHRDRAAGQQGREPRTHP